MPFLFVLFPCISNFISYLLTSHTEHPELTIMLRLSLCLLPALLFVACMSQPSIDEEMPPPDVSFTDIELDSLGRAIEEEIAMGVADKLDRTLDMEQIFARMMWPHVPDDEEIEDFFNGYNQGVTRDGMNFAEQIVAQWYNTGSLRFLGVRRDSSGTRLLYRFSSPTEGLNYIEFLVGERDGEPVLVDMYTSLLGENFSAVMRHSYLQPGSNPLYRLVGKGVNGEELSAALLEIKQMMQAGEYQEILDYYKTLPKSLRLQKLVHIQRIQAAAQLDDDMQYETILGDAIALFPNDPGIDLMLMDYYTLRGQYDSVLHLVDRLDEQMQDPYLDYQRGSMALEKGKYDQAREYGEKLIAFDSSMVEPYLLMIAIAMYEKDAKALSESLERMQLSGTSDIAFENVESDPDFVWFVESSEYETLKKTYQK